MSKAKIRIISVPQDKPSKESAYAGQQGWALNTGNHYFDDSLSSPDPFKASKTLGPDPRDISNMEVEEGETLLRQMPDGSMAHFDIGGKPHSQGGTPIVGHPGDFIFSKTSKMKLGGPILQNFGKSVDTDKKYTPADLAKQYPINKYKAIVDNPESDKLQTVSAQRLIKSYQQKLGELALVQEAFKGFPNGIPEVAAISESGQPEMKFGGYMQYGGVGNSIVEVNQEDPRGMYIRKEAGNAPYNSWQQPVEPFRFDQNPNSATVNNPNYPWVNRFPEQIDAAPIAEHPLPTNDTTPENVSSLEMMNPYQGPTTPQVNINPYTPAPYGISNSDKLSKLSSLYSAANISRYPNYVAPVRLKTAETTFLSPEREIAATQEQAGTQSMINALTQDGSRQRAVSSSIQGQALGNIANILGRTNNANVEIANRANAQNADITNKQSELNARRMDELYKQGVISDQQYRNSQSQAFANFAKTNAQAQANAAKTSWTNAIHNKSPYYIDPTTGRPAYNPNFTPDFENMTGQGSSESTNMFSDIVKHYISQGVSKEKAQEFAHRDLSYTRQRTKNSPFNMKSNSTTTTTAPNLQDNYYDPYNGYKVGGQY